MKRIVSLGVLLFCFLSILSAYTYTVTGVIDQDTTWSLFDNYQLMGTVYVADGVTLTIEGGVNVWFHNGATLVVYGAINATGNSTHHVTFEPWQFAANPNTRYTNIQLVYPESSSFSYCDFTAADNWEGIVRVENGSGSYNFSHCTFNLNPGGNAVNIYGGAGSFSFQSCDMSQVNGAGIRVQSNCAVDIDDLDVDYCTKGISVVDGYNPSLDADNVVINHSTSYPIEACARHFAAMSSLFFANSGVAKLRLLDSYLDQDVFLTDFGMPYMLTYNLTVYNGTTLTLDEGVQLGMNNFGIITVNGNLVTLGSSSAPVLFYPSVGGAVWCSIEFGNNAVGNLNYTDFQNGGYNNQYGYAYATINAVNPSSLLLSHCNFTGGQYRTISYTGANPGTLNLTQVNIAGNSGAGIYIGNRYINFWNSGISISNCGSTLHLPAGLVNAISQPVFTNNTDNAIHVVADGYYTNATTFHNFGYPYKVEINLQAEGNITTTIEAGCQIYLGYSCSINISGQILVNGTVANPVIFGAINPDQHWQGFVLTANCSNAVFNNCSFQNAAYVSTYGYYTDVIYIDNSAQVSIQNCSIINAHGRGVYTYVSSGGDIINITNLSIDGCALEAVYIRSSEFALNINGLSVSNCNSYPLSITPNQAGSLSGLNFGNNLYNRIRLLNGPNVYTSTMANHGYPYQVGSDILVMGGNTLTIAAGNTFYLENAVNITVSGNLIATGTSDNPIVFTKLPDAPYNWQMLKAYNGSSVNLAYCQINHSGKISSYGYTTNAIENEGAASFILQNCSINNSQGRGIYVSATGTDDAINLSNLTINTCAAEGILINDPYANLNINGLNVSHCASYPLVINPAHADNIANLTFAENNPDRIRLFNTNGVETITFADFGYPYQLDTNLYLYSGSTITFNPGVVFYIANGMSMEINGNLSALGTIENPITFTKIPESAYHWQTLNLYNYCGSAVFSYCNFSFGGKTSPYGHNTYLLLDDGAGSVSIDHCSFSNSQGNGIWIQNKATTESTSIQNTSISNLTGSGIVVNTDVFNLNVNGITLCDGGGYPIYIRGIHAHQFTGLNISNFAQNYIGIMGYNQSFNATWQNHGIPYRMLSHYYVNDWVTLTLSAGVNIVFNDYTAFYINGAIICNGTQSQPVSITGLNPDSGSTWLGLKLADTEYTSHFYYTDFKNAGINEQYDYPDEYNTLYAANADLVIDHCSFAQGSHNYLKIMNGSIVNITHSTFSGAGGYGIITSYSNVSILYSTITGCDTAGIYYYWGELQFGINQSQWNRIYGNGINLHNACIEALLAQYIYWGSLNSGVIDAGIHDDNEGSAMVTFNPWFNEELTMLYDYTLDTPENVQITRLNSSTLRISWNGATGATSYKIVSSDAPDAQVWTPLANGLDTLFYDVTLPVGADKKFYRVYGVR